MSANPDLLNYGNFIKAAYDVYKLHPAVLSPSQDQYKDFPPGYTLRYNIHMTDFFLGQNITAYYGFIAFSNDNPKDLVIAIRGTVGYMEWWDDIHVFPAENPFAENGGLVVSGFLDLYRSLKVSEPHQEALAIPLTETVKAPSNDRFNIDDSEKLTVVGHSLGASLATLYGVHLDSKDKNVEIFTYASPCVGNQEFVDYYNGRIKNSCRIYNEPDLVPKLLLAFDYKHVDTAYEVNSFVDPKIKKSIGCFHYLSTYLYLLGGSLKAVGACLQHPV
jgi:triacylglycerol lipase